MSQQHKPSDTKTSKRHSAQRLAKHKIKFNKMPRKLKLPALSVSVTDKVGLNNSELQHKKNLRCNNKSSS